MPRTLIRGRTVVREIEGRRDAAVLSDGGVLVEDDRIAATGPYGELRRHNPDARMLTLSCRGS